MPARPRGSPVFGSVHLNASETTLDHPQTSDRTRRHVYPAAPVGFGDLGHVGLPCDRPVAPFVMSDVVFGDTARHQVILTFMPNPLPAIEEVAFIICGSDIEEFLPVCGFVAEGALSPARTARPLIAKNAMSSRQVVGFFFLREGHSPRPYGRPPYRPNYCQAGDLCDITPDSVMSGDCQELYAPR